MLYYRGLGTPQDYHEAFRWLRQAAADGDALGMRDLGILYENGQGVPQNHQMARVWFETALEHPDQHAGAGDSSR